MLYAIISRDRPDSLSQRRRSRPAHLERLRALQDAGRLILAGPHPSIDTPEPGEAGFTGSLVVAEFSDLQAAEAWAEADPYLLDGVYAEVQVKPFIKVLPA